MSEPPLYQEYEVLKRLKLRASELFDLLNVGIIAPVARRGPDAMYWAATIDALATSYHQLRMGCAIWWDFDLGRPSFLPAHAEWSQPHVPFYPFDDEEQQAWARRVYKLKKACAPGPYPYPDRLARHRGRSRGALALTVDRRMRSGFEVAPLRATCTLLPRQRTGRASAVLPAVPERRARMMLSD
ncbi:hypothetical protein [Bradyrhizobium sp. 192]|uniref:hypothetical protein n=1 Tax=Bradyrhizobium sp. 192 TaxID=2782660 RepID=UPI001FFFC7D2|nr:hypothetical protein [Bradyrhizobium sp. 192]UPJ60544.1 hypothetical protein IVB24_13410 [Bradyrhizobium sp. 192]